MSRWLDNEGRKSRWAMIVGILLCVVFLSAVVAFAVNAPLHSVAFWREMNAADRDGLLFVLLVWLVLMKR